VALLLIGTPRDGAAVIERLLGHGDDVRVIEDDAALASDWAALGAHVARGRADDADLVERAAAGARTVVVMERLGAGVTEVVRAVTSGARLASEHIRLIVCVPRLDAAAAEAVRRSGLEHVILRTGAGRTRPWARPPAVDKIAEAIDAADDLSGRPRLDLDLRSPRGWRALALSPPARGVVRRGGSGTRAR
jgi:hypothetical protein